ncbi:transporter substrate-binding domain-containing protein [Chromobacterium sp. IIBBL 290-4]|uniref:transporter substrate-binding domain-containing protein n=1 Tax=Chromobacterium sp. IIBBL 290-4 TaxID=2953890 RepID=UPI0020B6FB80|nr:transporter substrate-binding domain-containing protein [Chromobacterium sp. IIBBL 290-4]UTH74662.1 transporter substrate-binding domain-containing protein [Chromobacterium sp. IIBBL 290-4]
MTPRLAAARSLAAWFAMLPLCLSGHADARSLADILKTRQLRVCIAPIHSAIAIATPKDCREQCTFSGLVWEEVQAFARNLGDVKIKALRIGWDEQFFDKNGKTDRDGSYTPQLLASGACDLYPSRLTKTAWRLKKMDFVTLFPSRMMVIAGHDWHDRLKSSAQLAGLSAAAERDTSYHTWLLEQNRTVYAANPVRIELMPTDDGLAAVDNGKVDFTMLDSDIAIWSAHHQLKHAFVAFPVGPKDEIGWAFRKEDKDLQEAVSRFFDDQRSHPDSEFNRIWKRYHGRTLTEFISLVAAVNG